MPAKHIVIVKNQPNGAANIIQKYEVFEVKDIYSSTIELSALEDIRRKMLSEQHRVEKWSKTILTEMTQE